MFFCINIFISIGWSSSLQFDKIFFYNLREYLYLVTSFILIHYITFIQPDSLHLAEMHFRLHSPNDWLDNYLISKTHVVNKCKYPLMISL